MRLLQMARRLSRMSADEFLTRARQEAGKRADAALYRMGADPYRAARDDPDRRGKFFRDPGEVPRIIDALRRRMPDEADRIVAQAERVLCRRFDLLGYRDLDFGREIDWQLDPVHAKRAPAVPWPSIRFLDFHETGDHKIVWELNRCQFLVALGKAYRLTGDERFAAGMKELWYDWRSKNPYPIGINWASTLEVAFRAVSWMWAAFLLEGTPADSVAFQRDVARELGRAGWYIERFLSTWFSPNTHLLGEAVALFLIGARYPGLQRAARWRKTGWTITLEQAKRQVRADGFHFEQSVYYHVYALDFFLHARALAERNGIAAKELDEAVRRMAAALAVLSGAGAPPRFGDDDGGRLFDPTRNGAAEMRDPLSTAAVLFGDAEFKAAAPGLIEETLWLTGAESAAVFDSIPAAAAAPRSKALPACGIYAMAAAAPPCQLFIDGGEQGWGPAGHGHADALSVQLAAGGRLRLADPGTYCYAGRGSERDDFRGTPAHNTMAVDARHQAEPAGPFAWGPRPAVDVRRWFAGDAFDLFDGSHSGYQRLAEPVTHRRQVLRFGGARWLVRDVAEGRGAHDLDIRWHFAPEAAVAEAGAGAVARWGGEALAVLPAGDGAWRRAIETTAYSPVYGARVPAPLVRWSSRTAVPAQFAAVLVYGPEADGARFERVEQGAEGITVYEYSSEDGRFVFGFAETPGNWRFGQWSGDAAVFAFGNPDRSAVLLVAGVTRLEHSGHAILNSPERLDAVECRKHRRAWRLAAPAGLAADLLPLP